MMRGLAEACAAVLSSNGVVKEPERQAFQTAIRELYHPDECTKNYLDEYFAECVIGKSDNLLNGFKECCIAEYRRLILSVSLSVASADGIVDDNDTRVLRRLAELLGFNPNNVYEKIDRGETGLGITDPWWEIFKVSATASIDEVATAYRKLAVQFHPDIWANANEEQRKMADARMKKINAAFERAKHDIDARQEAATNSQREAAVRAKQKAAAKAKQRAARAKQTAAAKAKLEAFDTANRADHGVSSTFFRAYKRKELRKINKPFFVFVGSVLIVLIFAMVHFQKKYF